VFEIEISKFLFLLTNNLTSVVFPAPEGEETIIIIPVWSELILKN
jgi:hypothetical protein